MKTSTPPELLIEKPVQILAETPTIKHSKNPKPI